MKYSKDEAFRMLGDLGVARWETNPPEQGRIKWFGDSDELIAEGDYSVILSVGPGAVYTMGYAVETYPALGIPFVDKIDEFPSFVADIKTEGEIWKRAEAVGEAIGADFVYQCRTLLVAVSNFTIAD